MPLMIPKQASELADAIQRCGQLVGEFGGLQAKGRIKATAHSELTQLTTRFQRIDEVLEKALRAGHLSAAQQRSIAGNFERIAAILERAAGKSR
jgi:hypothetical protein